MNVLVTGAAGFIGMHVAQALLARGDRVLGIDNLNAYYDPALKQARLDTLASQPGFAFEAIDVSDGATLERVLRAWRPERVVHLAAQAGVRYSIDHPEAYVASNLVGFANILEACRHGPVDHLVYASSSSVYGGVTELPWHEDQRVDTPVSLYAATKKSNELMAHVYSHLFTLPTTGLRFFTVYGPWGRPDMAAWRFTEAILAGRAIEVYNNGKMSRDFTYIDDIVEGVVRTLDRVPAPTKGAPPAKIFNIGNHTPVPLTAFIATLEGLLGTKAQMNLLPLQDGDVVDTYADVSALESWVGFRPATPLAEGLGRFVDWYRQTWLNRR